MLIKFAETTWLNVEPDEVARIDIDASHFENLRDAVYYVEITYDDGRKETSGYFRTAEEARACVENFTRALMGE